MPWPTRRVPASTMGRPTSGPLVARSGEADPESFARGIVLRRLSAAPCTRHQLHDHLLERGIGEEVVDRVLDRFTEVGLIDDTEYAAMWVTSRQRTRGTARSVLRQELHRKGVGVEAIESALATISSEDEAVRARALVDRKLASMGAVDSKAVGRRLTNLLIRRGYAPGISYATVRDALHSHGVQLAEDFQ